MLRISAARPAIAAGAFALTMALLASLQAVSEPRAAPPTLQDTGLYADPSTLKVDPAHLAFSPQYPLWTDGAAKRRWLSLPAGVVIDASDPDAWVFPVGTRLWKEFSFAGTPVETRYIERRADGSWLYAAYAWSADARSATLVSERGRRNAFPLGEGRAHRIPAVSDCKVCHEGGRTPVLGFSALQLSPDRNPLGSQDAASPDLTTLINKGLLVGWPSSRAAPRIAATSATERAALGYMHGNCGHCHNDQGPLRNLGLFLRHVEGTAQENGVASTLEQPVRAAAPGQSPDAVLRVAPQRPGSSALLQRVSSRQPALQMPPLGTELVDHDAVTLLERWINEKKPATSSHQKGS
jgi:hypothetical protein